MRDGANSNLYQTLSSKRRPIVGALSPTIRPPSAASATSISPRISGEKPVERFPQVMMSTTFMTYNLRDRAFLDRRSYSSRPSRVRRKNPACRSFRAKPASRGKSSRKPKRADRDRFASRGDRGLADPLSARDAALAAGRLPLAKMMNFAAGTST